MGLLKRFFLCGSLALVCCTARAYDQFIISTLGAVDPAYDDGADAGAADDPVQRSVLAGGVTGHQGIAVGFLFQMPGGYDPTAFGAVAQLAAVPLFETVIGTDFLDARLYIVQDSVAADNLFDAPNLGAVVTSFALPGSDWPLQAAADGSLASLSTVGAGTTSPLLDDGDGTPYWLVMETSGAGGVGDSVFDYWYRSNSASDPFRVGSLVGGLLPPNEAGRSPAYSLTFIGVPEPSSAMILSLGCLSGLLLRRRRAA